MIYFCVPAHNEEKTVGVVLWKLRHVMAELPRDYQILVGDDASTDGSAGVLEPYRRVLPLVMMRTAARRGYAATLEMLLRQAVRMSRYPKRDSVVVLQADFTDDLDGAADLLRRLESGADVAVGGPVTDVVKPGFFERLAIGYARRALARFEWPEDVDPLNTLSAYRLICVKRALEEAGPDSRLLAWDGRTANAALLKAALPHARRVESVELRRHAERAQRSRRFRPLELVSNVRRFAAGTSATGMIAVAALVPDEVKGDLSVLHGPEGNGASESGSASPRTADARPRRSEGGRKSGDSTRRSRGTGSRAAGDRPPRRRKPKSDEGAAATTSTDAPAAAAAGAGGEKQSDAEAGDRPKRRRSRGGQRKRGGRNRRKRPPSTGGDVSAGEDSSTAGSSPAATGADGGGDRPSDADGTRQVVVAEGNTEQPKKRRRRGRRGGKGRGGRRRKTGTNDASNEGEQKQEPRAAEGSST